MVQEGLWDIQYQVQVQGRLLVWIHSLVYLSHCCPLRYPLREVIHSSLFVHNDEYPGAIVHKLFTIICEKGIDKFTLM